MIRRTSLSLTLALLSGATALIHPPAAQAKKWTITQRQDRLKKEIAGGLKSGDLTQKEASSLTDEETNIEAKEVKMKEKNGGKLSVPDQNKLEGMLNKLSLRIQKLKLSKRVK